jgi:hypothetical protein
MISCEVRDHLKTKGTEQTIEWKIKLSYKGGMIGNCGEREKNLKEVEKTVAVTTEESFVREGLDVPRLDLPVWNGL